MGIPDHPTCLLRKLYAGQEATVRTRYGTKDQFIIGTGIRQGLYNYYAEYIHHIKCQTRCITSWNQDCQEK